ncbi:putative aminotransferase family protein [Neofusicoccum parvum UCRNP2]|uniref:Putative aminotransferase family protein n=1 Tax=Botryosphaeria parva (strain UCR-NP2) TaxID=1287680 RepID=R1EMU5_BOTPV|nr:putative aminotransferase family protein [Neofusicoccum parvum UCRNP2]
MGEVASTNDSSPFGRKLRKDFLFDDDYININHGSFGTYPKSVQKSFRHWQDCAEARPDQFIRYDYPVELRKSRALMADYLNVPFETVVFVPNATTGVNTVLRNLEYEDGDVIVYFATIYGACEKTVKYICETTKAQEAKVEYTYPIEDDELVRRFKEVVAKERAAGRNVKVAIFDVVVSMPGVRMPFEALTEACRELGVLSLIDGAHGVGQIELDLGKLNPDFFVSNCHKWLLTPRGCAVFHVPLRTQPLIRSTLPTSHGFSPRPVPGAPASINPLPPTGESNFESNFAFTGSGDWSPFLCVGAALAYRASLGGEAAVRSYCSALARQGGARAAALLGTEVLENGAGTLGRCFFANVRLPLDLAACEALAVARAAERAAAGKKAVAREEVPALVKNWAARTMVMEYGGFQALIEYGGGWWARLSAMVYLEVADFEWAAGVLKKVCERAEEGEWLDG